jgi:predicted ATPase
MEAIEEALASVKQTGETWYEAELIRIKAKFLSSASRADLRIVQSLLELSIATASGQSARQWESRARIDLAKLFAQVSRDAAARDVLAPMRDWTEIDLPERSHAAKLMRRLNS